MIAIASLRSGCSCFGVQVSLGGNDVMVVEDALAALLIVVEDIFVSLSMIKDC